MYLTNFRIKNNRKTQILTGLHLPAVTQKGSAVFLSYSEKMLLVVSTIRQFRGPKINSAHTASVVRFNELIMQN